MKLRATLFFNLIALLTLAQAPADFENIQLPDETYIKDAGPDGGFRSGPIFLPNQYTDAGSFDFWEGWVISNLTDTITPGFLNEGSAFAGSGNNGSDNYAVCYAPFPETIHIELIDASPLGLYITNSTYTALSMKNGDSFAKKFGGSTGNDPDSLVVSFRAWHKGNLSVDSVLVYLADYTFDDNSMDYILKDWTYVDLSRLGTADSLQCTMYSSDTGSFGINTPSYFCIDDIEVGILYSNDNRPALEDIIIYPNPSHDYINFKDPPSGPVKIYNTYGQCVISVNEVVDAIDITTLAPGKYYLRTARQMIPFVKVP